MKLIVTFFSILLSHQIYSQKNVVLTIQHKLGTADFALNQAATSTMGNNFKLSRVDYYVSGFTLIHDGGTETAIQPGVYVLAKAPTVVVAPLGNFNITQLEGIKFNIGVPDSVNHQDISQLPEEHPLSFQAPSMHWGWSDGYRFVCVEGKAGTSLNTTFEMHGLGDSYYYEQTVTTAGAETGNTIYINLNADYIQALRTINLNNGPIDHGVGASDLRVLENFRDYVFTEAANTPVSIQEQQQHLLSVYPNPSNQTVTVSLPENTVILNIYSLDGKLLISKSTEGEQSIQVSSLSPGFYIVESVSKNLIVSKTKIVVE